MKKVVIESPYAGDIPRNVSYARNCMADSFKRGEAPFASHLLYPQEGVLDDSDLIQRAQGIDAGFLWGGHAELIVFYVDLGWSEGMLAALQYWTNRRYPMEIRSC